MNGAPWVKELTNKYSSGVAHAFILHFNVADYVDHTNLLRDYLARFLSSRDIVCFFNRAEGITFPLESMRQRFIQEMGLGGPVDPALAALAAVAGGGAGGEEVSLPREPARALPLLERLLKLEAKTAVILDFTEMLVPDGELSAMSPEDRDSLIFLQRWARDPVIMERGNLVILVTRNLADIHSALRAASSRIEAIALPLPDYEARLAYIQFLQEESESGLNLGDITSEQFAMTTAGLSKIHIEDIKLRAEELGTPVTYELVRERKEDIIRSEFADVIEILEPTFGFELIGGMESVKSFFRSNIIRPLKEGNRRRAPMGVLLTGPAGTGKSAIVMAAARESGVNCINLNLARILGQYVGMSERNLEKALRCIEALAPALVFIDEIDQAIQRGTGTGNEVSNRLFKRILEFMSDTSHRGRIVFLAATNRPDLMDAALKRPGRFDKKIPCLAPDEKEREAIFRVMLAKYGIGHELSNADFTEAARSTEGHTGAEIEAVVIKAFEVAEDSGSSSVRAGDLKHALEAIRPSTTDIEFMTLLALGECNDKDLLPERYRTKLDDRGKLEQEIQARTEQSPRRGRREL